MTRAHRHHGLQPCVVTPNCLECPLPLCKFDGREGRAGYDAWVRERWLRLGYNGGSLSKRGMA